MPPDIRLGPEQPEACFRRAASDMLIAEHKLSGTLLEDHCYHAQQCAEKSLKGVLILRGQDIPYTHDIALLITRLREIGLTPPVNLNQARKLTGYAVQGRYPGLDEDAGELEWEEAVLLSRMALEWARGQIDSG